MYGNPHMFSMHHFSSATLLGEDIFGEKPEPAQAKSTSIWTGVPQNHGGLMGEYKATSSRVKATKPKHEWSKLKLIQNLGASLVPPLGEWQTHGHALPGTALAAGPFAALLSARLSGQLPRSGGWEQVGNVKSFTAVVWNLGESFNLFLCCFGFLEKNIGDFSVDKTSTFEKREAEGG